ncbi:MAG: hypothetical protein JOS17DRAFT_820496 [Linnemannia elongata]|nr:MAG: hypothetical protein JOS17DRAFT_820496 [Linnemannia elongata]
MRSTPLFLLLTSTLLTTSHLVTAQANQAFCTTCIVTSSIKTSPTCDGLQNQPPPTSGALTAQQKTCYCGLAQASATDGGGGGAWIQGCVGPTSCDPATVTMILQTYVNLRSSACEGLPAPTAGVVAPPPSNSTAAGSGTGSAAPPVLPVSIQQQQQPGNAAVSSTTSKVAVVLATIVAAIAALL